jgi:hypothetical protein
MVQILEDQPSFASQFMKSNMNTASALAQAFAGELQQRKQSQALKRLTGMDLSGLPPEAQQEIVKQFAKSSAQKQLLQESFPGKFGSKLTSPAQETAEKLRGISPDQQRNQLKSEPNQQSEEGFDISEFTPEERVKMSMINPNVSKQLTEEEKLQFKKDVHQQGLIDKSYEVHKPFIDDITNSYKGFETEMKPKLLQMQSLKDDQLIGPTSAKFLETMGIPLGALEDPSSELYSKLSQDLLKGLPETYGNRILKVEVDNFLKTIPTLMNSPEGRRMIASNMLKLGQLKETFYKEMRRQQIDLLDKNKKFPKDFEQRVFDNVQPHINKLTNQFVKMSEIKAVPKGTVPFFGPTGEISFVPKNAIEWAEKNGGERIW